MKLGLDARMLVGKWKHRGIGTYILSILNSNDKNEILGLVPKNQFIDTYKYESKGFSFFPFWEQILLPFFIKKGNFSHFLFPSITSPLLKIKSLKKILVIYDLIYMIPFSELPPSKSFYNNFGRIYRRFIVPLSLKSTDYIITISDFSKFELYNIFNVPLKNITVIPCSISNDWFVNDIIPASIRKKYFITVTGDAPSKNLMNIILTFHKLKIDNVLNGFQLLIVGLNNKSKIKFQKILISMDLQNDIILKDFVHKNELQKLYRESWASLTLSLYEGFGIPIVEAMASGTPVVCSNTTSLPEVAGGCAILTNPRSIDDIANSIIKIMNETNDNRDIISANGFHHSLKYKESNVKYVIDKFWEEIKL
jgi:glycosyltransferase involved in cell wall biosynthesis